MIAEHLLPPIPPHPVSFNANAGPCPECGDALVGWSEYVRHHGWNVTWACMTPGCGYYKTLSAMAWLGSVCSLPFLPPLSLIDAEEEEEHAADVEALTIPLRMPVSDTRDLDKRYGCRDCGEPFCTGECTGSAPSASAYAYRSLIR